MASVERPRAPCASCPVLTVMCRAVEVTVRRQVRSAVVALVFMGALAACSAEAAQPRGHQTYDSLEHLRDAVVQAGVGCSGFEIRLAGQVAKCNDWTVLMLFPDISQRDPLVSKLTGDTTRDRVVLIGENWGVMGARNDLETLQRTMGGAIEGRGDGRG